MEADNHQKQVPLSGQHIKIDADLPLAKSSLGRKKICIETTCMLSDSIARSTDAKQRLASMRKLVMAVILCSIFMCVEVAGGVKANSLAVLTDAAHLLSDVAAFAISLFSLWAGGWEATPRQSCGFFRIEILGALFSIQLIWLLAGILLFEAVTRIIHDRGEVQGYVMFAVSAFGLVVNTSMAVLLSHDHGHHDHCHGWHCHSHDHGHTGCERDHNHINDVKHSNFHGNSDHDHENDREDSRGNDQRISSDHHHLGQANDKDVWEPLLKNARDEGDNSHSVLKGVNEKLRNINIYGAYLHALGDSIQSIGVMIGGAIIWYKARMEDH